jgi:CRP/FNR family cyclic AMP-dependent transcriptional regulator
MGGTVNRTPGRAEQTAGQGAGTGGPGGFLGRLAPSDRRDLVALGRTIRLRSGATALIEGQVSSRVLLILEGHVRAWSSSPDGREVLLAIRRPGDLVGEFSALDGEPHSATVSAMDDVQAVAIPASAFREFLRTHSDAALAVLELVTERLRDADRKRAEFGSMDTTGRVAARLVELAERHGAAPAEGEGEGQGVRIELRLSQEELATWASASREAVSRALRTFRERGWIATRRRALTVLDLEALRARSG